MSLTPNVPLELIAATNQVNAQVLINKNSLISAYMMQPTVINMTATAPPGSPVNGDAYIVAGPATGAFADHEDDFAIWFDQIGEWLFVTPRQGWYAHDIDTGADYEFSYTASVGSWDPRPGTGSVTSVDIVGTMYGLTFTGGPITGSGSFTFTGTLAAPIGNITGLGTGVETFLATPSSANLIAAVTDETGTGALVFATSPTLVTPNLGTPTALVLTNATGLVATTECIAGYIATVADKTYKIVVKIPHGATITEATTISESGTCTATFKINTTALGGTANSVSSSETSQSHASANVASAGDDIQLTVSSNSTCLGLSFSLKYTRTVS